MRCTAHALALATLALTTPASAQVTLVDGFWSTTFEGCATGPVGPGDICDGLEAVDSTYTCGPGGTPSQITPDANYPAGGGGAGYAIFYEGDVRNSMSTPMTVRLPAPTPELWLRFYRSWPVGQTWGGIFEHKIIYAFTDTSIAADVNFPGGEDGIHLQPRNAFVPDLAFEGVGWRTLYGGQLIGDGTWHAFEFHLRLGTPGSSDGAFQMWVDGANVADATGLDWFAAGGVAATGWTRIDLPNNHNVSTLPGCVMSSVDDIAVAVPSFGGFVEDAEGRPMIGTLAGATPDTDAGTVLDAGALLDAGTSLDAGPADGADAGTSSTSGGCGCRVRPARSRSLWSISLLALALAASRQR